LFVRIKKTTVKEGKKIKMYLVETWGKGRWPWGFFWPEFEELFSVWKWRPGHHGWCCHCYSWLTFSADDSVATIVH
jgi:hypothetical protein